MVFSIPNHIIYKNLIPRTVDSAWEVECSINWALSNINITNACIATPQDQTKFGRGSLFNVCAWKICARITEINAKEKVIYFCLCIHMSDYVFTVSVTISIITSAPATQL